MLRAGERRRGRASVDWPHPRLGARSPLRFALLGLTSRLTAAGAGHGKPGGRACARPRQLPFNQRRAICSIRSRLTSANTTMGRDTTSSDGATLPLQASEPEKPLCSAAPKLRDSPSVAYRTRRDATSRRSIFRRTAPAFDTSPCQVWRRQFSPGGAFLLGRLIPPARETMPARARSPA